MIPRKLSLHLSGMKAPEERIFKLPRLAWSCLMQLLLCDTGISQSGPAQIGPTQLGGIKVCTTQVSSSHDGTNQRGTAQAGIAQVGTYQPDIGQGELHEIGSAEI